MTAAAPLVEDCHPLSELGVLCQRGVAEAPVVGMLTVRRPAGQPELVLMELLDGGRLSLPRAPGDAGANGATRRHQIWRAARTGLPKLLRREALVA